MNPAISGTAHPQRAPLRALRAVLFAAVCVVLAAAGHAAMSGHQAPLAALLAAGAVVAAAAWAAAGRRRGAPAIGGALLAAQAGLHLLFATLQPPPAAGHTTAPLPSASHGGHAGHAAHAAHDPAAHAAQVADAAHAAHAVPAVETGGTFGSTLAAVAGGHGSAGMLAVHLLAAVVCGLWLWRGETAFFRLLRVLHALAVPPLVRRWAAAPPLLPDPGPATRPYHRDPPRPRTVRLAHTLTGRGPPAARRSHGAPAHALALAC